MNVTQSITEVVINATPGFVEPGSAAHNYIQSHALTVLGVIALAIILIIAIIFVSMDLLVDIWKVPFAIGVDILKYLGISNSHYVIASAVLGPLVLFLLIGLKNRSVSVAMALLSFAISITMFVAFPPSVGYLILVIPYNTVLMVIGCILD